MAKKKQTKTESAKGIEFVPDEPAAVSSTASPVPVPTEPEVAAPILSRAELDFETRSPAFKELALPKLPTLEKQNRARLLIQSPDRIFFYWSLRSNPFQTLHRSLGVESAGYTLVLRLIDTTSEREEFVPIEPEGTHWFHTEAGRSYRAEIGFYSTSKPFVRVLYSNNVTTPRKSPSPRAATEAEWRVTSHKFAEVLDVSGFQKDAFDVAIAGDEPAAAEASTRTAFEQLTGAATDLNAASAEDIRFALMSIAAGRTIEELRWKIGAALFAILQANAERLNARRAAELMKEHFQIDEIEFEEEEIVGTVLGASAVNFPRRFKTRGYSPLSSSSKV
jgi:5-carboxymethyl-2-hydroxymuconate isomerase